MKKKKSVEPESVGCSQQDNSKKPHRTDSSSSSTGDEWLCASTRVPLPEETFHPPPAWNKRKPIPSTSSVSSKIEKIAARRLSAPTSVCSSEEDDDDRISENVTDICTPTTSFSRFNFSTFRTKKPSKLLGLRRTSLPAPATLNPRFRKTAISPEVAPKWPSFLNTQRKNVVLELLPSSTKSSTNAERFIISRNELLEDTIEVEESPIKTDLNERTERTPSPTKHASIESVVADSQCLGGVIRTRSLENSRSGVFHGALAKHAGTWPTVKKAAFETATERSGGDAEEEINTSATTQFCLYSSPDEKSRGCTDSAEKPAVSSADTKSSASGDVVAATQDLVAESDEEAHLLSERFDIDEISRLNSNNPSAEKRMEKEDDSNENESSSDEDDVITRSTIGKMNLTGVVRELAEYILERRSERLMIKRDPNVQTATYEVTQTVSAFGMSVSWLSPKALMFAPPFARDPATVTLALPILTVPNKYDPEMPIFLNPIVVSTTRDPGVPEESNV